jgi:hypothetical protein
MATLLDLLDQERVFRIDPALGLRELEVRRLYVLPEARKWIETILPTGASTWKIQETPSEQLDALTYEFCVGAPLAVGTRFKCLTHLGDGIWELKTADLRLFGWFLQKDCFIVSDCDDTDRIKQSKLYRGYCEQAVRRRAALKLDEPNYITGDNPDDVVSDWT